ncbi:MAG: hypothetical protein AAGM22_01550 [Acidobacteriota bacterium]
MSTRAPLQASPSAPNSGRALPSRRAFEEKSTDSESARSLAPKAAAAASGGAGGAGGAGGGSSTSFGGLWGPPIQRLSIPGLAESAIRLHPGARNRLDKFTKNRKVRQVRAVLGNLGLAGGIRGKDARHAFKSQIAAEKKWNKRFGLEEKREKPEEKEESSKAQCCADGASPFPENRHDASRHEAAANRPDADAAPDAEVPPAASAAPEAADAAAAAPPAAADNTAAADGHKQTDGERARHRSEARRLFDARRPSTRSVAEIRASSAARHARRKERLGDIASGGRGTESAVAAKISDRQNAALAKAGIGGPATGQSLAGHLHGAVSSHPSMGSVNRRSVMFHAAGRLGESRASRLESHMRASGGGAHSGALAGLADRQAADAQAESVGDFFSSAEA